MTIEDLKEIRRSMELPNDVKSIEPKDWIHDEERKILRFGSRDE